MRTKYCVGFFVGIFLFLCITGIACQLGGQYMKNQNLPQQAQAKEDIGISLQADGEAVKNEGYYLMERNGYVIVYLYDKKSVFEYTDIRMEDLPEELMQEIRTGKYIETTEALYGFLENYSS